MTKDESKGLVLVAEDNAVSRQLMANILTAHGYEVMQAVDGGSAIKVVEENNVILAVVDQFMSPKGGFDFVRHLSMNDYNIPVIMVTAYQISDLLIEARKFGITRVLQKPVDPDRLIEIVRRALGSKKEILEEDSSLASEIYDGAYTPEELMQKTLDLAERNLTNKKSPPFSALIADAGGHVLSEASIPRSAYNDPMSFPEVLAIHKAFEKTGKTSLAGCSLYCSHEPSLFGQIMALYADIETVRYALPFAECMDALNDKESRVREQIALPLDKRAQSYVHVKEARASDLLNRWKTSGRK